MSSPPRDSEELLIEYLRVTQDTCPRCDFSLNGLNEPRCPECGLTLRLQVGHERPIVGWILAAMIPSGFSMIATIMLAIPLLDELIRPGFGSSVPIEFLLAEGFGVLSTFFGLGLIWQRRRFVCLPEGMQSATAVGTWVAHIMVAIVLFVAL